MSSTVKSGGNSVVLINDLYRLALHECADIQRKIGTAKPDRDLAKRLAEADRDFLLNHAYPHQATHFGDHVDGDRKTQDGAIAYAAELDKASHAEIAAVLKGPSLKTAFVKPEITTQPRSLRFGLLRSFLSSSKPVTPSKPDVHGGLFYRRMEMMQVLRVLKTCQTGILANEKGYFTPSIVSLNMDQFPSSEKDWNVVIRKAREAMQPEFVDACVVDYKGGSTSPHSRGFGLIVWRPNEAGTPAKSQVGIRTRFYYGAEITPFPDIEAADQAFAKILLAKTGGDVSAALASQDQHAINDGVSVRHTWEGNFMGGAFADDRTHPSAVVRASVLEPA